MSVDKVVYLDDYRIATRSTSMEQSTDTPPTPSLFEGVPISPLFTSDDTLYIVRKRLSKLIRETRAKKLFMPIATDIDPFWTGCVEGGCFNNQFSPYMVMFSVLRDYPRDFYNFVDGYIVANRHQFDKLVSDFNRVYMAAISGKGHGYPKGTCSVDEFIRMGGLFYLILKTGDMSFGVKLNTFGYLSNEWCGEKLTVNLRLRVVDEYSRRLQGCSFAGADWQQFFYRATQFTDNDSLWLLNFSSLDLMSRVDGALNMEHLINSLDRECTISARDGKMVIVLPNSDIMIDFLRDLYGFEIREDTGVSRSGKLSLHTRYLGQRYLMITNFAA